MKIGGGVPVFYLYLFNGYRHPAALIRHQSHRFRNEKISFYLFQYFPAFKCFRFKIGREHIIGTLFLFMIHGDIIG